MTIINFKPEAVTKNLISGLKDRTKDIITQRFGLGNSDRKTLEAIGRQYGVTRERIRQIENFAINSIRQSSIFESAQNHFAELKDILEQKGKIVSEDEILEYLARNPKEKNHLFFLLVVGTDFEKLKEDDEFNHRWTIDREEAERVHNSLRKLHDKFSEEHLVPEDEILDIFRESAKEHINREIKDEIIRSWLNISKIISKNALGEWGLAISPHIRPRGMRDLAFLILRKHGSPMHFTEVADKIKDNFSRLAHPATVHNELIKDQRFVLVGRGLYALQEWGYKTGTVKDVIREILKIKGPLTKDEIINIVSNERYVKKNTIIINLQNRNHFTKNENGKYVIV